MSDSDRNFFLSRRVLLGLTQREISDALGVTETTVSNWESGRNMPRLSLIKKLAEVYRVSTSRIAAEVGAIAEANA